MPLLKGSHQVEDTWTPVEDIEALPESGPAIVPLELWESARAHLMGRNQPLGVRLKNDQSLERIAEDIPHFALVALEFPKFSDGRAYSQATLLRDRYGFTGEVRAVGAVKRDQAQFMKRCGFDTFEVPTQAEADAWAEALSRYDLAYQPAPDGAAPVFRRRHPRAAVE